MNRCVFAALLLVAGCSSVNSDVESLAGRVNSADDSTDWCVILQEADSLCVRRDDLSARDMAVTQGAIVEIVNNLVDCDSVDAAARGMRLWVDNYRYMTERDSSGMARAMADVAATNPLLDARRIDSVYTRGLEQLSALERAVSRIRR